MSLFYLFEVVAGEVGGGGRHVAEEGQLIGHVVPHAAADVAALTVRLAEAADPTYLDAVTGPRGVLMRCTYVVNVERASAGVQGNRRWLCGPFKSKSLNL